MPKSQRIEENDRVALYARVTRVKEDEITVRIEGFSTPVTIRSQWVELVEKHKTVKAKELGL